MSDSLNKPKLNFNNSIELFSQAKKLFPGGVNSPARDFSQVGDYPLFIQRAKKAHLFDVDGNRYIDYVNSWGASIAGHSNEEVVDFLFQALEDGFSYGAPTKSSIELAKKIIDYFPSIEMMRFVSSGTEACMSAVRLARSYTKRDLILKFNGHYHGHSDGMLVGSGSGLATLSIPSSSGVLKESAAKTLVVDFNDCLALGDIFSSYGSKIAAVILEVVSGNCSMILPKIEFLELAMELCKKYHVLVICDEVMTGFRVSLNGAQGVYNLDPDITVLGKVIGGGFPCALYGGKAHIMEKVAPIGDMYQAGTLSANPIAMACGYKTLEILTRDNVFENTAKLTAKLASSIQSLANKYQIAIKTNYLGAMFGYVFTNQDLNRKNQVDASDFSRFVEFFNLMLNQGVYFPPSPYEACFVSIAHDSQDIDQTLDKVDRAFNQLK